MADPQKGDHGAAPRPTELSDLSARSDDAVRGGSGVEPCIRPPSEIQPCFKPGFVRPCIRPPRGG